MLKNGNVKDTMSPNKSFFHRLSPNLTPCPYRMSANCTEPINKCVLPRTAALLIHIYIGTAQFTNDIMNTENGQNKKTGSVLYASSF